MEETVEALELKRRKLARQLVEVGDIRRGMISVNFRKCGRENCVCAQPSHRGHGPQYLWNSTVGGRSVAKNLKLGPELEKVQAEVANYKRFTELSRQLIEVNEKICRLRPVREIEDERELEQLKKKLRRQFSRKSARR